jgi:carbamoyl-phosphate synthase small subunit
MDWRAALYLEHGHLFEGIGLGAEVARGGETVFNTGMTGYQEIFTDPSYCQQIVVMSYPHIGNTGTNKQDTESDRLSLSGVVLREYSMFPSNWRNSLSLDDYLTRAGCPGISEVDTRAITQKLRSEGSQRGIIFPAGTWSGDELKARGKKLLEGVESMEGLELVSKVSCQTPYEFNETGLAPETDSGTIVVYDYGVKTNILRHFKERKFKVHVVPYNYPYQETLALKPSAVVLSNGPGDPALVPIGEVQNLLGKAPVFAICMGHQLLARALGGSTFKLKFGHHGVNHPVKDLVTGKVLITSQNHGFSVQEEGLRSRDITISHLSLNDRTVEGFFSEKMKLYSVQFHPEAKPGPNDAAQIFDTFIRGFIL